MKVIEDNGKGIFRNLNRNIALGFFKRKGYNVKYVLFKASVEIIPSTLIKPLR